RIDKLSSERRETIIKQLEAESKTSPGDEERKEWTSRTIEHLQAIQEGKARNSMGVIPALASLADPSLAHDPFLREMVAYALNFWDGDAAENARAEKALAKLSFDDGRGERLKIGDNE